MATHIRQWIEKASMTTADLEGGMNGGVLTPNQARVFLRDAIEETVILKGSDVFDSGAPKFEVPKISFGSRILRAGTEFTRLVDGDRTEADTGLVTLSTELFRGEVPISDEVFEDNVEQAGLADSIMALIAEAVGRDLEEIAIKSTPTDADTTFAAFSDGGLVKQLIDSTTANEVACGGETTMKGVFKLLISTLPSRYRRRWSEFVFYASPTKCDTYAESLSDRGTALGDSNTSDKPALRYRSIPVTEVPLLTGTQNALNFDNYVILCVPKNLKTGFHRRVKVEKFRDPREGGMSFIPSVRFDVAWAQDSAVVLGTGVVAAS